MKQLIIDTVEENPGIKALALIAAVVEKTQNAVEPALIEECVKDGSIVELEYILPSMDYRVKTMYFPKETSFIFNQKKNGGFTQRAGCIDMGSRRFGPVEDK